MDKTMEDRYVQAYENYSNNEISYKQWQDICVWVLGEIMSKNEEVVSRLQKFNKLQVLGGISAREFMKK